LNSNVDYADVPHAEYPNIVNENELDNCITEQEIKKTISKLKNGKSCGIDNVTNEYIKSSCDILMPIYVKHFNTVLNTGNIPDA